MSKIPLRLGSKLVRLGKLTLEHWEIFARSNISKKTGSKSRTSSGAHTRQDTSAVVSTLPFHKSDNGHGNVPTDYEDTLKDNLNIPSQTGRKKDATKENEGPYYVKKPSQNELPPEVKVDPSERDIPDHIPDFTSRHTQVKKHEAPRHQQTIQSSGPEIINVESHTGAVSVLPWVSEEVFFKQGSSYNWPHGFINRGSFGSVFLVRHQNRGDIAALKIVNIAKRDSKVLVREIAALTRIREKNNRFVLRQPLGVGDVIWTSDGGHLHLLFVSAYSPIWHLKQIVMCDALGSLYWRPLWILWAAGSH